MDTRNKIKTRKLNEEEGRKRKAELKRRKALLFKCKDKLIGNNDIIVSPLVNKVKLEDGESTNSVKQEVGEEEDVMVKLVMVEEKVDLSEEPWMEEGECSAEIGHALEAPSELATLPEPGQSSNPLVGIVSDLPTPPLSETVNNLVDVVGGMSAVLDEVKEKVSMGSPEVPLPQISSSEGTISNQDIPTHIETPQDEDNHIDLANEDEMGAKHCLVCYKDVPCPRDDTNDNPPLIDKQLEGIFFLNKLLGIPSTSLVNFLEMCPDTNPASWIHLCSECQEMGTNAFRIYNEIMNASKQLNRIQKQIIDKIKCSTIGDPQTNSLQFGRSDICQMVTNVSRKFVSEHDYGHVLDPFPEGDREASRLATESKRRCDEEQSPKSKETHQIGTAIVVTVTDQRSPPATTSTVQIPKASSRSTPPGVVHAVYNDTCGCKCGKRFGSKPALVNHVRQMTEEWRFICRRCGMRHFHKCRLQQHLKISKECGNALSCSNFSTKRPLPRKPRIRKVVGSLTGRTNQLPGSSFQQIRKWNRLPRKSYLFDIFRSNNSGKESPKFLCGVGQCRKGFLFLTDLKRHMNRMHKIDNPLSQFARGCRFCGDMFRSQEEWLDHRRLKRSSAAQVCPLWWDKFLSDL